MKIYEKIFAYLDLNKEISDGSVPTIKAIKSKKTPIKEKDKEFAEEKLKSEIRKTDKGMSVIEQISLYFGMVLGVLFSAIVTKIEKSEISNIEINIPVIISSAIIALVIIPIAYEKLRIKPSTPYLFKLGLFVQHGVFWEVIIKSFGKVLSRF